MLDTVDNRSAPCAADMFVVRHESAAPIIAQHLENTGRDHVHVVSAGDDKPYPTRIPDVAHHPAHYRRFTNFSPWPSSATILRS